MRYQHRYLTELFIIFCLASFASYVFADELSIHQTNLNLVERIAKLEEGQKSIVTEMRTRFNAIDKRFELIDKRFESLIREFDHRFESIDKRFETIDKRFETIDKRFETIDKRFETIDKRFETIDKRFDLVDNHFETIDKRFEAIDKRFDLVDNHFETIDKRFEAIDKRFDFVINQISRQETLIFTMFSVLITSILALIGYILWDRKTVFDKMEQLIQLNIQKCLKPEHEVIHEAVTSDVANVRKTETVNQQINENFKIPVMMQSKLRDVFNYINQNPEMRPILNAV
jgi:archaellum component FlaC